MILPVIFGLTAIAAFNYLLHRDPMHPGFLQAALWSLVLSFYYFYSDLFIPVSSAVYWLILGGATSFTVGSFMSTIGHKPHFGRNCVLSRGAPKNVGLIFLLLVTVGGLVLFALRARDLSLTGPFENAFANLRYGASIGKDETGGFGQLAYFLPLSYSAAAAAVLKRYCCDEARRPSKWLVVASVLIALIYGVLSSGRGFIMILAVLLAGILLILRIARPRAAVLVLVALACGVFYVGGVLVGKGGSIDRKSIVDVRQRDSLRGWQHPGFELLLGL